jgi:nucleoside-diphosphate-sugar epimerase
VSPASVEMRVLITGITGFIGSELAKLLVKDHEIFGLVRDDKFGNTELPTGVHIVNGDVLDKDLREKLAPVDPEVVMHLAALTPVRSSYERSTDYGKTNYLGTVNLVEAVRGLSLSQFVHASTMEVYKSSSTTMSEEDPLEGGTPYGVSKAAADLYVQVAGKCWDFPYTILRPGNTFGRSFALPDEARHYLVEKCVIGMLTEKVVQLDGFPDRVRSWLYYLDHIEAYRSVLGNKKATQKIYNVVTEPHSVGDIVELIARLTDFKGDIKWGTNPRPNDPVMLMTTPEKIRFDIGWRPKYTISDGLKKTVDYWRERI